MNSKMYYINMHNNINRLKAYNINIVGDYLCPLCMKAYKEENIKKIPTEEDVPQHSLGGSRIALTCRHCNSRCGYEIDIHLFNAIKASEQKQFLPDTKRKIRIKKDGQTLNAEMHVDNDRTIDLFVDTKRNNPKVWDNFHNNILLPNKLVDIEDLPLKKDERRIGAAIIKNAYLLLFAKTGYSFLYDAYYDDLRKQILNPDVYYLPDRLWTLQNLSVPDGIYLTQNNEYRGFFIIYTLKLKLKYRVCVLIPTPMVPYLSATKALEKIEANTSIKTLKLPDIDYLTDKDAITRLRKWCYSWRMAF